MVLSDNWHQPVGPDWAECSLWVREAQVHDLPRILEAEGDAWYSKGLAAQEAFRRFFDRSTIFGHYTAAVESLLPPVPPIRTSLPGYGKRASSSAFSPACRAPDSSQRSAVDRRRSGHQ
jgi:hypothetical protein